MKVCTNFSNIQPMMRDSTEEILISFSYRCEGFTWLFRKVLNCSHEGIGTCRREKLIEEFIPHVFPRKDRIRCKGMELDFGFLL